MIVFIDQNYIKLLFSTICTIFIHYHQIRFIKINRAIFKHKMLLMQPIIFKLRSYFTYRYYVSKLTLPSRDKELGTIIYSFVIARDSRDLCSRMNVQSRIKVTYIQKGAVEFRHSAKFIQFKTI